MDERAFTEMARSHRGALTRYAAGIVGQADAEDIVQVALLQAWMFDAPIEHERAFLYRVVRNVALNQAKRLRLDTTELEDWHGEGVDVAELAQQRAEAAALLAALRALDPAQRSRFTRFLSLPLGERSGMERQAAWRIRQRLREHMDSAHGGR